MAKGMEKSITSTLDRASFEALFRKYFPALMTFALKYVPDEDSAREVVHNVFINLWEKKDSLDTSVPLKSYLFRSVHNRSLNVLRDHKKFADEEMPDIIHEENIQSHMEAMELEDKIKEAIDSLPDKCREVFELSRFEGLKNSEIAERLDISIKTVENQMTKALKIMREKLIHYLSLVVWLLWNGIN